MFSPLRHASSIVWKNKPIQLSFFLTNRCNAKCPFCFYLQNNSELENTNNELTLDEIQNISSSMDNLLWLAFSGGEIFLRKDIVEISEVFYTNNKPIYMLYPTNGLMPQRILANMESIVKRCKNSVIIVKLSLDGLYEDHDIIRQTPGNFERVMECYRLLSPLVQKYKNFELGFNTVFTAENQDKMDSIIDFVATLENSKTHTISLIRGDLKDQSHKDVDFSLYQRAKEKLANGLKSQQGQHYKFTGGKVKVAQDIMQRDLIYHTTQEQRRLIPCYAGKINVVLSETGNVFPCEIQDHSFGNVRDHAYSINSVLQSAAAQQFFHKTKEKPCFCTHECYFMTNILLNPKLYPTLAKEYIKVRVA